MSQRVQHWSECSSYTAREIAEPSVPEYNYDCGGMVGIDYGKPGAQVFITSDYLLNNLWTGQTTQTSGLISADVPCHGVALHRVSGPLYAGLRRVPFQAGSPAEGGSLTGRTARRRVLRIALPGEAGQAGAQSGGLHATQRADLLAAEEPLGIRLNGEAVTLTMRTPGDDIDLAAGFLVSEGVVRSASDILQIRICTGDRCGHGEHEGMGNIADVTLGPGAAVPAGLRRNFLTTSACGVCGKASIRDICQLPAAGLLGDQVPVQPLVLAQLPGQLREAQRVFSATGGLHAAGVFGAEGQLLAVREDVGRHNAVDKVVGWALRGDRLPLVGCILLVSGRASFELVQKAVMAGIPVLAAVSAPSSLAVELAEQAGLTLVGFLRGNSMNVYTAPQRIVGVPAPDLPVGPVR